jgi:hypothetical protein
VGAVLDLVRVLFEPAAVFERVREKPKFLAPFIALALAVVLITILQLPYSKAGMVAQMSARPGVTPDQVQTALKFASVGVVVAPVAYAIILVINAFLLWVVVSLVGGEARFMTLLSVTTYASIAYVLLSVVGLIVLTMRGTSAIASPLDLQPALGLDLLVPDAKGFALALLRGINPFSLYGLFLTATGIAVTHQTSKGAAYTAAVIQLLIALTITGLLTVAGGS